MKLAAVLLFCAVFSLLYVPAASAEDLDPALYSNGSNCIGTVWCESTNLNATDPISGETNVLEFILKTAAQGGGDPSVITGDVDMSDGFVIRFEMVSGTPEIFILHGPVTPYNISDGAGANPLSETSAANNNFATWTPSAGQVGYDTVTSPPNQGYGFEVVTPEPASIFLLSAGLGLIGLGARGRMRRN